MLNTALESMNLLSRRMLHFEPLWFPAIRGGWISPQILVMWFHYSKNNPFTAHPVPHGTTINLINKSSALRENEQKHFYFSSLFYCVFLLLYGFCSRNIYVPLSHVGAVFVIVICCRFCFFIYLLQIFLFFAMHKLMISFSVRAWRIIYLPFFVLYNEQWQSSGIACFHCSIHAHANVSRYAWIRYSIEDAA